MFDPGAPTPQYGSAYDVTNWNLPRSPLAQMQATKTGV